MCVFQTGFPVPTMRFTSVTGQTDAPARGRIQSQQTLAIGLRLAACYGQHTTLYMSGFDVICYTVMSTEIPYIDIFFSTQIWDSAKQPISTFSALRNVKTSRAHFSKNTNPRPMRTLPVFLTSEPTFIFTCFITAYTFLE